MRPATIAAVAITCASAFGCGGACGDPENIEIHGDYDGDVTITWEASNAMGLYFTHPDATIPGGPGDMVDGYSYWVLEATSFPSGFESPVVYRRLTDGSKDETEAHGGIAGGEPLECGVVYKVAVVALGGSEVAYAEWECD
jgi:hypothetical protein